MHHSRVHDESIAGELVKCSRCGEETRKKPSHVQKCENHFCSSDCEAQFRSEQFKGEGGPAWKGGKVTVVCEYCGDELERKQYRLERSENQFCDPECHYSWLDEVHDRSGENAARWQGGLETVECAVCGDTKEVKPHRVENYDRHFCGEECKGEWVSKNFSGDGNPRWKGGFDLYRAVVALLGDESWNTIAGRVRERDGECQNCGVEPATKSLSVHHIVPVLSGGVNEDELLMSLCDTCHPKAEAYCSDLPGFDRFLVE